jgi:hypothetical protein
MMIGKRPIRLAEQRRDLGPKSAKGGNGYQTAGPVSAVDDHTNRPLQLMPTENPLLVSLEHRAVGGLLAPPGTPPLGHDDLPQLEDFLAVKGLTRQHHLEAVEFGRVVGPGYLKPRVSL